MALAYISTHRKIVKFRLPTSVAGYRRRFEAQTKEIKIAGSPKRKAVLKIFRSWTLMTAEERLGNVRFRQLLRELRISPRSPKLAWHRLIASNRDKLWAISDWVPCDDKGLAEMALRDEDQIHEWVFKQRMNSQ